MKFLDLTLPTPAENLACDEALLDLCERDGGNGGILRFWEAQQHFIVLGYSNQAASEVHLDRARQDGIPVLRRCTGGGAVLQGPGCLNYSLILPITAPVHETNVSIMQRHATALGVDVRGHSDLAHGDLKISGNAQRRRRRYLLFHGSFLVNLDIEHVERVLPMPSRQPTYRRHRPHREFLKNLATENRTIQEALKHTWQAVEQFNDIPLESIATVAGKYSSEEWTFKF